MDTANLGQVEFLKGPSSLMSGLNAIGGLVNYVSRQPTTGPIQNEADVFLDSFGSFRSHFGSGGSTPVRGLDYRFDVSGAKFNSFIDGDFRDVTGLASQFDYRMTDSFKMFLAIEYKKDSGHAYWGTPVVPISFAGSHAVNGVVSDTAINTFDGSVIVPLVSAECTVRRTRQPASPTKRAMSTGGACWASNWVFTEPNSSRASDNTRAFSDPRIRRPQSVAANIMPGSPERD